jgi:muramoyltetrapeptide carboxypeptidase LdcA involved in peptidoglycan recycling
VAGVLIGRARDYTLSEQIALDVAVLQVIHHEFGATTIPIVTNVDFGHTDPQFIIPIGITMQIDCHEQRISLTEPWLS